MSRLLMQLICICDSIVKRLRPARLAGSKEGWEIFIVNRNEERPHGVVVDKRGDSDLHHAIPSFFLLAHEVSVLVGTKVGIGTKSRRCKNGGEKGKCLEEHVCV